MDRPYNIPVFIIISFSIGIFIGFYVDSEYAYETWISLLIFSGFVFAFFRAKSLFVQDKLFPLLSFLLFIILGFWANKLHQPENSKHHYIHENQNHPAYLKIDIEQQLRSTTFQYNFIGKVREFNHKPVRGKILLNISKDSLKNNLFLGDQVSLYTKLEDISQPLNPYQFDYNAYMANKRILKRANVTLDQIYRTESKTTSLLFQTAKLRQNLKQKLKTHEFSLGQIELMNALLLGQRTELSKDTYTQFADAGVVHVLAVSGLHIGIIVFFLMVVFKPIAVYFPKGNFIRVLLIILLLWIYAYLVGLSPSVLRAVTMFSFLSLGLLSKRRVFTLNMLCLSAFLLLLYNPHLLFEVGFQLSYSAVLSILIFQQKIYSLLEIKNKFINYIWRLSAVTLAAQLGVLPLSLFYFHQFPGLFFISNLLIIPFLGVILGAGFIVLILAAFNQLPSFIAGLYSSILDLLQTIIDWIAAQDFFLVRHVYFSETMLLLSLFLISAIAFLIYKKQQVYIFFILIGCILLQSVHIHELHKIRNTKAFYVFHKSRHPVFGFQNGQALNLVVAQEDSSLFQLSFLEGLQNEQGIGKIEMAQPSKSFYVFDKRRVMIIDSSRQAATSATISTTDIILQNSPMINLERTIDSLNPQRIIADGSNYKRMISIWKETCVRKNIPFHYTGESGAYLILR